MLSTTIFTFFKIFFQAIAYNTYITSQWTRDCSTVFMEVANSPGRFFFVATFCQVEKSDPPPDPIFFGRAPYNLSPTADKKSL